MIRLKPDFPLLTDGITLIKSKSIRMGCRSPHDAGPIGVGMMLVNIIGRRIVLAGGTLPSPPEEEVGDLMLQHAPAALESCFRLGRAKSPQVRYQNMVFEHYCPEGRHEFRLVRRIKRVPNEPVGFIWVNRVGHKIPVHVEVVVTAEEDVQLPWGVLVLRILKLKKPEVAEGASSAQIGTIIALPLLPAVQICPVTGSSPTL